MIARTWLRLGGALTSVWRPGAAVLDQAVYAGTNFLTLVIVARLLDVAEVGIFVLAFSVQAVSLTVQSINYGPMRVDGATIPMTHRAQYFSAQLYSTVWSALALCGALLAVLLAFDLLAWPIALAFTSYVLTAQLNEFLRVKNMTLFQMEQLISQDAITCLLRLVLFGAAWLLSAQSLSMVLSILTAAFLASASVDVLRDRNLLSALAFQGILRQNMRQGKWWCLEGMASSGLLQFLYFFVASVLGAQAVAGLSAVQSLVNAPSIVGVGLFNLTIPRARQELVYVGLGAWGRILLLSGALICAVQWLLLLAMYQVGEPLLVWIYGARFAEFAHLVPIACLQYVAIPAGLACGVAYRTAQQTGLVFGAYGVSGLAMMIATPTLVAGWGLTGAALVLALFYWLWLFALIVCLPRAIRAATAVAVEG